MAGGCSSHDEAREIRVEGSGLGDEFDPRHAGHVEVDQADVWEGFLQRGQRGCATFYPRVGVAARDVEQGRPRS